MQGCKGTGKNNFKLEKFETIHLSMLYNEAVILQDVVITRQSKLLVH